MPLIKIEITSSMVALYGAALATLTAIKVLHDMLNDKIRLKMTFQTGMRILGENNRTDHFTIRVTSKSKRTTQITHVGMRFLPDWDNALVFTDENTRALTDDNPSTTYLKPESTVPRLNDLWFIYVIDARGREYHLYMRRFGRLKWWQYRIRNLFRRLRPTKGD